jgi:hypothetical protein
MTESDLREAVRSRLGEGPGIIVDEFFSEQNNEDRYRVVVVSMTKTAQYEIGTHADDAAYADFLDFIEGDQ